jgi:hypothetical protein
MAKGATPSGDALIDETSRRVAECTKANDAAGATQLARLRGSYLLSGV